jgi:membrane protein DedA with SNARE-associated domain
MLYEAFLKMAEFVGAVGYLGIFIMTFIESTFIPIPAEVTLIPAGYLIHKGELNFWWVYFASVLGTLGGSLANYAIAYHFGRRLLLKYGKYFFIDESKLDKMESFFHRHGAISMFTGRLLPGVKHFISFPAGLAQMRLRTFIAYTSLGGALWCGLLLGLGYVIGENEQMVNYYIKKLNYFILAGAAILITAYILHRRRSKSEH